MTGAFLESLAYFVLVCSDTSVHSRSRLTAGWYCVDTLGCTWKFLVVGGGARVPDLVLVRLKRVELEREVPEVPEGDGLVCGAGGQDELGVHFLVHYSPLSFPS